MSGTEIAGSTCITVRIIHPRTGDVLRVYDKGPYILRKSNYSIDVISGYKVVAKVSSEFLIIVDHA